MIAIVGGKGGCGKTTTTLGVARVLAQRGVRTRAVDLDVGMPNLHRLAGVERTPTLATRFGDAGDGDRLPASQDGHRDGAERRDEIVDRQGVAVVPAPRAPVEIDVEAALESCSRREGVALVDTPAGAGPDVAAPLRVADASVLVTTARDASVEDARKTRRVAASLDAPVLGVVVTRADRVPERLRSALAPDRAVAVPDLAEPLAADPARRAYETVAQWIQRRRRAEYAGRGAGRNRRDRLGSRDRRADPRGAAGQSSRQPHGRCPECGRDRRAESGSDSGDPDDPHADGWQR